MDRVDGCMGWLDGRVGWWVRVGAMMDRVGGCMSWVDGCTERLGMKRVGGHQVVCGYVGWVDGCVRWIECETVRGTRWVEEQCQWVGWMDEGLDGSTGGRVDG